MQPGGCLTVPAALARSVSVVKLYKSAIDFLSHPSGACPLADRDCRASLHRDGAVEDLVAPGARARLEIDDDGVFVAQGVVFGLEICLDHAMKRLRTITRPKPGRPDSVSRIQVPRVGARRHARADARARPGARGRTRGPRFTHALTADRSRDQRGT